MFGKETVVEIPAGDFGGRAAEHPFRRDIAEGHHLLVVEHDNGIDGHFRQFEESVFAQVQGLLRLPDAGPVEQGQAAFPTGGGGYGLELGPQDMPFPADQGHLATGLVLAGKDPVEEGRKPWAVVG